MTGAVVNLMLNLLIIVLLAVTIAYCWALNRRIRILQDGKSELAQLLKHFDESTQRASESIIALQTASKKIGENIQFRVEKANYMLDDLNYAIERGSKLVNQLEANFAVSRARAKVEAEEPREEGAAPLQSPAMEKLPMEKTVTNREKMAASLEAVLERVVGRNKALLGDEEEAPPPPPARGREPSRARSKAEQELLEMIRAGVKG
jgi:hypothetical protein